MKSFKEQRIAKGTWRTLKTGSTAVDFYSNDYLGLARSPPLFSQIQEEQNEVFKKWGKIGSTGSRLLSGNHTYAETVERDIAHFHGGDAALIFQSGFAANLGVVEALSALNKTILFDSAIHASIKKGLRLSKTAAYPFRHMDLNHLEARLKKQKHPCAIIVEGVNSKTGQIAPLDELLDLTKRFGAEVILDEAHSTGLWGERGEGLGYPYRREIYARVCTFGKALGISGAAVISGRDFRETLINSASSFIYSTAPSFFHLAAIRAVYRNLPHAGRNALKKNALLFDGSPSPLKILPFPGANRVKDKAEELKRAGLLTSALVSPTVQRGKEVLRVCLHSFNTIKEIEQLKELVL